MKYEIHDGSDPVIAAVQAAALEQSFLRRWTYPFIVFMIYITWLTYMNILDFWYLFNEFWTVSVTMIFGSFIAGATACPITTFDSWSWTASSKKDNLILQSAVLTR